MLAKRLSACYWVVLAVVAASAAQAAEPEPKALIQKAIAAHGGEKELTKLQISVSQIAGTIHSPEGELTFSGEVSSDQAKRQRATLQLDLAGQKITIVSVVAGDSGWTKFNEAVVDMDADQLIAARAQAYSHWLTTLTPLVGPEFKLASRGEIKVGNRAAYGVIVSQAGQGDVHLFFDEETSLLVKTEQRLKDETGREVTEESILSNHEEQGTRQARKIAVRRNDKPYFEAESTSLQPVEKLDDSLFKRP